jgi:hypothetical protein
MSNVVSKFTLYIQNINGTNVVNTNDSTTSINGATAGVARYVSIPSPATYWIPPSGAAVDAIGSIPSNVLTPSTALLGLVLTDLTALNLVPPGTVLTTIDYIRSSGNVVAGGTSNGVTFRLTYTGTYATLSVGGSTRVVTGQVQRVAVRGQALTVRSAVEADVDLFAGNLALLITDQPVE